MLFAFVICWPVLEGSWSKSVDTDQTAHVGAVLSGFPLFDQ